MLLKPSLFNLLFLQQPEKYGYYNTYSGALITLDSPIEQFLSGGEPQIRKKLTELGFLVPAEVDEIRRFVLERKQSQFSVQNRVAHFVVAPTMNCQAHCAYCFESGVDRKRSMSAETAEAASRFLCQEIERIQPQRVVLAFFGGEPLLQRQRILEIGHSLKTYCDGKGITLSTQFVTNGILLDRSLAEEYCREINLRHAQITLDGTREYYCQAKGIDCYDQVVQNIGDICDLIQVLVRLNISPDNRDDILRVIDDLLLRHGLRNKIKLSLARIQNFSGTDLSSEDCLSRLEYAQFRAACYCSPAWAGSSLPPKDLLPHVHKCFCGMENCMASAIGPDGELYKCEHHYGIPGEIIGSVEAGHFYNTSEMDFYGPLDAKCLERNCVLLPACTGGCRSEYLHAGVPQDCDEQLQEVLLNLQTYYNVTH